MAKIPESFDMGSSDGMEPEELLWLIQRMYTTLARAINQKPSVIERAEDGQTSDSFLSNGDININSTTFKVEMLTKHIDNATVSWTTLS